MCQNRVTAIMREVHPCMLSCVLCFVFPDPYILSTQVGGHKSHDVQMGPQSSYHVYQFIGHARVLEVPPFIARLFKFNPWSLCQMVVSPLALWKIGITHRFFFFCVNQSEKGTHTHTPTHFRDNPTTPPLSARLIPLRHGNAMAWCPQCRECALETEAFDESFPCAEMNIWVWVKLKHQGTAGFSHWFHLLGFQNGYPFLTHSHMLIPRCWF